MRALLSATVAAVLSAALLAPPSGAADEPDLPDKAAPGAATHAEAALARAVALFEEKTPEQARRALGRGPDATMVLNQLSRVYADLSPADREVADRLRARPTDGSGGAVGDRYTVPEATPYCGTVVCIHFVTSTADAPPLTDGDSDGVPDYVEQALQVTESVNSTFVQAGYRRPRSDGTTGGGSGLVDIYLSDLGDLGLYGYCSYDSDPPPTGPYDRAAYCAIDDDFSSTQFPSHSPTENMQVTLAHEYFHAVQFAYDAWEDPWIMEATATWAEDELFDAVNDNRQYLPAGQLGSPGMPLDTWTQRGWAQYGNWIFFRYLSERFTAKTGILPNIVLRMWKTMDSTLGAANNNYSLQAVVKTLSSHNASFKPTYLAFAEANRRPGKAYSEGSAYRIAAPRVTRTLKSSARATVWLSGTTRHLTSYTARVRPGSGLSGSTWKVRTNVDLGQASTGSAARVSAHLTSGKIISKAVSVNRDGVGSLAIGFSNQSVKYVELTIVNASTKTSCWTAIDQPYYSCFGTPANDSVKQKFKFTAFR